MSILCIYLSIYISIGSRRNTVDLHPPPIARIQPGPDELKSAFQQKLARDKWTSRAIMSTLRAQYMHGMCRFNLNNTHIL